MAKKTAGSRASSKAVKRVKWSDPEVILFAGEEQLAVGAIQQHSLSDIAGYIFGKKKEDVEAEWKKIVNQIGEMINAASYIMNDFSLNEITFQLGFSAEGHIVFVAKAGVQTTISAKFTRERVPAKN